MAPHCDELVLHAPRTCIYCDKYPEWQRLRLYHKVNFTGQHYADLAQCPAETRRSLGTIENWAGNAPVDPRQHAYLELLDRS